MLWLPDISSMCQRCDGSFPWTPYSRRKLEPKLSYLRLSTLRNVLPSFLTLINNQLIHHHQNPEENKESHLCFFPTHLTFPIKTFIQNFQLFPSSAPHFYYCPKHIMSTSYFRFPKFNICLNDYLIQSSFLNLRPRQNFIS